MFYLVSHLLFQVFFCLYTNVGLVTTNAAKGLPGLPCLYPTRRFCRIQQAMPTTRDKHAATTAIIGVIEAEFELLDGAWAVEANDALLLDVLPISASVIVEVAST